MEKYETFSTVTDFAFFVEFDSNKFRLSNCADLKRSRLFNHELGTHREAWRCPKGLGKQVVYNARNCKKLTKLKRKIYSASRQDIKTAFNTAKWLVYKPIIPSLLGISPFSTRNSGPMNFGIIEASSCPLRSAIVGARHGVHPDAMFAGQKGLIALRSLLRKNDIIHLFENFKIIRSVVMKDDWHSMVKKTPTTLFDDLYNSIDV